MGQTALTMACRLGFRNIADILIDAGANMNYETTRGTYVRCVRRILQVCVLQAVRGLCVLQTCVP